MIPIYTIFARTVKYVGIAMVALCIFSGIFFNPSFAATADGTGTLLIIHTNDMHAREKEGDNYGSSIGIARIAAFAKKLKIDNPDTLLLDAGDTFHGMPMVNISRGENALKLMNAAGYDCMAPGNHDYDYGSDRLLELTKEANFSVLSANTYNKISKKALFKPYKIVDLQGLKVGVFGLTTPETAYKTNPNNVKNIIFTDPIDEARKLVKKLRPHVDVLVAITHIGVNNSSVITSDKLAAVVPGIDVIIDGHSHTTLPQGLVVGNTLIAQTGAYDVHVGFVQVTVKNHRILAKSAALYDEKAIKAIAPTADSSTAALLKDLEAKNAPLFATVVAYNPTELKNQQNFVRTQETLLGDLAADAARIETNADVAFTNGGSIRSELMAGPITKGDVAALFPFGNTIRVIRISGNDLLRVMELSLSKYPAPFGGFLQISGMQTTYNPSRPAGQRIVEMTIQGHPLELQKQYTVAINDFLATGGDGYDIFKCCPVVGEFSTYEELFADYLQQAYNGVIATGRILQKKSILSQAA